MTTLPPSLPLLSEGLDLPLYFFFLGIIISKGNAQAPKAQSKKLLPMRKRNIQLAIFTWCPISLILFSPDENTGVSIFIHCLLRNRHRKYICTNTYLRQHEQCIPSTSFFEAKMNKLHKDDTSEN